MAYDRSTFGDEFYSFDQELIISEFKQTVTYRRGADTVSIDAIPAGVVTEYDDRTGIDLAIGEGSFWLKLSQLTFGSGNFMPRLHDKITTAQGEVFAAGSSGKPRERR